MYRFRRLLSIASLCLLLLLCSFTFSACNSTPGGGGGSSDRVITDRFNNATIRPLGLATVTASCQPGEQMLSGGWALDPSAYRQKTVTRGGIRQNVIDEYFIAASYPSGPDSWSVTFTNQSTGNGVGNVLGFVHVECLSQGHTPTIVHQRGNSESGNSLTATCPSSTQLTGGGYNLNMLSQANLASTVIDFEDSTPLGLTSWRVDTDYSIGDLNLVGNNVTAYAVCTSSLTVSAGSISTVFAPSSNQSMVATQGTGSASCAYGQVPLGAGYQKVSFAPRAFPVTSFFPSYGSNTSSWDATVYGLPPLTLDSVPTTFGGTLRILPLCARIGPNLQEPRKN